MPGPTSTAPAQSAAPLSAAMRGQTDGLIRKFCPSALEKLKPFFSMTARIVEISESLCIIQSPK